MGLTEHVAVGMEGLAGKVGGGLERGWGGGGGGGIGLVFSWADVHKRTSITRDYAINCFLRWVISRES